MKEGSRNFYSWLDDNPIIEIHTADYTNDPAVIAHPKFQGDLAKKALEIYNVKI